MPTKAKKTIKAWGVLVRNDKGTRKEARSMVQVLAYYGIKARVVRVTLPAPEVR